MNTETRHTPFDVVIYGSITKAPEGTYQATLRAQGAPAPFAISVLTREGSDLDLTIQELAVRYNNHAALVEALAESDRLLEAIRNGYPDIKIDTRVIRVVKANRALLSQLEPKSVDLADRSPSDRRSSHDALVKCRLMLETLVNLHDGLPDGGDGITEQDWQDARDTLWPKGVDLQSKAFDYLESTLTPEVEL